MSYFVTGATGFIGKRLVHRLLQRPGSVVHFLVLERELPRLEDLYRRWGVDASRAIPVVGDVTRPLLGIDAARIAEMGIREIFLPGTPTSTAVDAIRRAVGA